MEELEVQEAKRDKSLTVALCREMWHACLGCGVSLLWLVCTAKCEAMLMEKAEMSAKMLECELFDRCLFSVGFLSVELFLKFHKP